MKIHFVNAEKGGVGKSFFTSVLVQYLVNRGILFYLVAADRSNPTSTNRYKDKPRYKTFWDESIRFIIFSESEKKEDAPDELFEMAIERDVVVDLAAQAFRPMSQWIAKKDVLQLAKEHRVKFCNWFISDGEDDSINLFLKSVNHYQSEMPHILVRNWGRCEDWEYFEENIELQQAIDKYRTPIIDFPKLSDGKRIKINAHRWTFEEALESPEFKIIAKQDIKTFLSKSYAALESSGAL
jgi:hypothetical protein